MLALKIKSQMLEFFLKKIEDYDILVRDMGFVQNLMGLFALHFHAWKWSLIS